MILILVALLMIAGCTPPEEIRPEEPAVSELPASSPAPSSSAAELPRSDSESAEVSIEDDKNPDDDFMNDDGSINIGVRDAAIQKVLDSVEEGTYVTYSAVGNTEHVELLNEWVTCFQMGESAQPLYLFHYGYGWGNALRLLEYKGGSHYTVTDCVSGESWKSAVIVKRAVDFVFGTDLPLNEYMAKAEACIVRHVPYSAAMLKYDLDLTPALGSMTAKEACERAILHNSDGHYGGGYMGGGWSSDHWEPKTSAGEAVVDGSSVATITGAVELMGRPCYLITIECEMVNGFPARGDLAISADGRLIFTDHRMGGDDWYSLRTDYDEQYIVTAH